MNSNSNYKNQNTRIGFAKWTYFYLNDETSKLFFIKVNFEEKTVDFDHKESSNFNGVALLRNAIQTSKVIPNVKMILNETAWSKHLQYYDLDVLRREICLELINSEKSLVEIKRKFV